MARNFTALPQNPAQPPFDPSLYDRIKTIEVSAKVFQSRSVPRIANGLARGSGSNRQIYIKPAAWSNSQNYQEFRWNAIANVVVNELIHHSRNDGRFSDENLDRAALRLMSPREQVAARTQMKQKDYLAGMTGHEAITGNCRATNTYGPPPKRNEK